MISPIVGRGYGTFGSIALICTRGYGIGIQVASVSAVIPFDIQFAYVQDMVSSLAYVQQQDPQFEYVRSVEITFTRR